MEKMNCWEFKKCGRQPGGEKAGELGVCVAANFDKMDKINGGSNGGRTCWVVAGTLCGGRIQGSFAQKIANCMGCEFYIKVRSEEGDFFKMSKDLLAIIRG